jgi:hypothetical protein
MLIDDSGEWWIGSEPGDISTFLVEYTQIEEAYPSTTFRPVQCPCGCNRFRLLRVVDMTRRTCLGCAASRFIARFSKAIHWEAAVQEETPEPYRCVGCAGEVANVTVGFAGYPEDPQLDSVKWFYVGVRCAGCGILGSFNGGKVGRGPTAEVIKQVTGELES